MSLAGEEALSNASSTALETPPHPPASSQTEKGEALARHSTAAADVKGHLRLRSESNLYGLSFAFKNPEELVCFKANTSREINSVGNSFGGSGSAWHRCNKIQKSYKPQRSYKPRTPPSSACSNPLTSSSLRPARSSSLRPARRPAITSRSSVSPSEAPSVPTSSSQSCRYTPPSALGPSPLSPPWPTPYLTLSAT